jgi:lipopolysaccharide export system protein LptA
VSRAPSPSLIAESRALAGVAALIVLFLAPPAHAQALTNTFGGLSESSNEPIDIESDALIVHAKDRSATFKGNVKAVQGSTILQANELNVHTGGEKPKEQANKEPAKPSENSAGGERKPETNQMLGISEDPMDIESDLLVVHDKEKYATFKGNVKAVQGPSTLSAGELTVNYVGDKLASASEATKALSAEGSEGGSAAQISKLEAKGNVVITSKKDGNDNVLKGERLVIDVERNEASFESAENAAEGNRVRAVFNLGQAEDASSDAKTDEAKPATAETTNSSGDKSDPGNGKSEGATAGSKTPDADHKSKLSKGNVTKIEAKGNVIITSGKDQTTTSDWAIYDLASQSVTVGGNVVLTQGQNVLNGNRLLIDLKTGESRFENTGNTAAGGRIRGLFMPKDAAKSKGAKPTDVKPAESKTEAKSGGNAEAGGEPLTPGEPDDIPLLLKPKL